MQITSIKTNNYPNYLKKPPSFKGLTNMLEKQIFAMPYQKAQRLVDCYDKSSIFVGHFPKDILEILRQNLQFI